MRTRQLVRLYPLVLSVVPALALFAANQGHQFLSSLLAPVLVSVGLASIVMALARLTTKDPDVAAFRAFVLIAWFFAAGQARELLPPDMWVFGWFVDTAIPSQAVLAAVALFLLRLDLRARGESVTKALAVFSAVLAGMNLYPIVREGQAAAIRRPAPRSHASRRLPSGPPPPASRPDVVVVVLDGYARGDVLRETFGFDNSAFLGELRRRGFFVASRALANYPQTALSLSTALNLDYLPALLSGVRGDSKDRTHLTKLIQKNRVLGLLHDAGYLSASFANGYEIAELRSVDRFVTGGSTVDPFLRAFLGLTPLRAFGRLTNQLPQGEIHRRTVEFAFAHGGGPLREVRPVFVFIHVVCPHPPFLFRADGGIPDDAELDRFTMHDGDHMKLDEPERPEWYRRRYVEQIRFVNDRVLRLLDAVDAIEGRPSAILLLGDHGPGSGLFWEEPGRTDLKERLGILLAGRLPGDEDRELYDTITPVNAFRALLRASLGADLPPLPDRSYFATWSRPYEPVPVETAAGGTVRLADRGKSAAIPSALSSSPETASR